MHLSIFDPLFYNLGTLMRRQHLTSKQIQEFRGMSAAELGAVFGQKGLTTAAHLFHQLLESFEIANRVALAAWGYRRAVENKDEYNAKEEWANLERALHDFSPDNWQPYRGDIQFAAQYFEALFNELGQHTLDRWEEVLFQWTKKLHDLLVSKGGPMEKPDVQRVVTEMQQISQNVYPCVVIDGVNHIERTDNLQPLCPVPMPMGSKRALVPPSCSNCLHLAGILSASS